MYVRIIRIYFSSTLVNRQENRFNTGSRLCHQTGCSCRSNRQTGNITTTVFLHFCIQFRISFGQTLNERVVLFAFVAVYFESTAFFCHFNRRTIGTEGHCLMYFFREFGCFFGSVAQSQSSKHIALRSDTYTRTTALTALLVDFLPQYTFGTFHFFVFRIGVDLIHDPFDLLQFKVDDIVHDTLCQCYMFFEEIEIKISIRLERIYYV